MFTSKLIEVEIVGLPLIVFVIVPTVSRACVLNIAFAGFIFVLPSIAMSIDEILAS